jgi:citronellol/citronellal dehydrogenase
MIVAVAAAYILTQNSRATTGNFFIDEEVLTETGITDFQPTPLAPECRRGLTSFSIKHLAR